jgi:L-fucose isomerase-like protein
MEKNLNLITLYSPLNDLNSLTGDKRDSLNIIRSIYNTKLLSSPQEITHGASDGAFTSLFIASGGSEELFLKIHKSLPKPVVVISDSYHNSLAASLEILTWLSNNGIMHKHINIPADPSERYVQDMTQELEYLEKIQIGISNISKQNIGLIGGESDWLISSKIDKERVAQKYGTCFTQIDTDEVVSRFNRETADDPESLLLLQKLNKNRDTHRLECDIKDALRLYNVLNNICKEFKLSSLTIKCFDLVKSCNSTACLALSLLNDNGVVAGCEGDIPSLWSMIIARELCSSVSFMANPSSIERVDRSVDFAHCTAPLSIGSAYRLTSHYETGIGIGVASKVNLGKYTLFKCGGEDLTKFYIYEGEVVQNTSVIERCRTQIKFIFKSEEDLDSYLESYLGNHSILIPGKHKRLLSRYIKLTNS